MQLNELISYLEQLNPGAPFSEGFENPHSYRGYYEQLAFEPTGKPSTAGELLAVAKSAHNQSFWGWKGGEFVMDDYTQCWLAEKGSTGEPLTKATLDHWFSETVMSDMQKEIDKLKSALSKANEKQVEIANVAGKYRAALQKIADSNGVDSGSVWARSVVEEALKTY
jgi:hypothetical protein